MAAIPEKNSVQVQQEFKKPVLGDELGLMTAIENTKINKSSVEEIKQVLRLTLIKIGLRSQNWPSDEEKLVLIEHIIKNYGNHTCEEIKLAFDMAIGGRLDVEVNCYENFSCLYFSNIMNAYRHWANEAYRHLPEKNNQQIENVPRETSDEEMAQWIMDWKYKVKEINNPIMIPPMFYDWLVEKGMINLTKEEKREILMTQAVAVRIYNLVELSKQEGEHGESRKQLNDFNTMRNAGVIEGIEIERLKEIAKKIAVFDYLKS
jgi:hypothetical protein